jgi:hypothetical protein
MTPIQNSRLTPAEFKRTIFYASPSVGTSPDDLLSPDYWRHVRRNLAPGNKIEAFAEDGSFYVELIVLGFSDDGVKVEFLFEPKVFAVSSVADIVFEGHTLRHAGQHRQWIVIRNAKGKKPAATLREGFSNSEDARSYVKEQIKAQAA